MKIISLILVALIMLGLSACMPGQNELTRVANPPGQIAGFWAGLWHGFIALFTFLLSLVKDNVNIYEVHNNGGWYNFGYILGVMIFFGGSGGGGCKARSKKRN